MANKSNRYKQMQQYMTYTLLGDLLLFILFWFSAGAGVIWAKALTAIVAILVSILCLAYLYLTQELLRKRSLWMTAAAGAILLLILISIVLRFPSPKPQSTVLPEITALITTQRI